MRRSFIRTAAALALVVLPSVARADTPNLFGFTTLGTQFFALGGSQFDVQFLFGRQAYSSRLFYQTDGIDGSTWFPILTTVGAFPAATSVPTPGSISALFTVGGTVGSAQTVTFALCNFFGTAPSTVSACTAPGPFFSTTNSTPSTNLRALSASDWNGLNPVGEGGALTTRNTVFGFEDANLVTSDYDFNDVVFSTNLATAVVPEPSTYALVGAGLLGMMLVRRRRQNA
jgi:hypothetical protein